MAYFVVIGGGIAGLTAANALVDSGAKVTVLEQSRELGGRARTRQEGDYSLNLGPHALYRDGVAEHTFTNWGIPFSGGNPRGTASTLRPVLVRGKEVYPAVKDSSTLLTSPLFTAREKLEVGRLLSSISGANGDPTETMGQWLDRWTRSERVRDYFSMVARVATYSGDFDHLSARAALEQMSLALKPGVLYLDGGWQTLVDGLAGRARSLGVQIHCGERVTRLGSVHADGIVLAADPETVELLTGVTLPARRAAYAATLDLCLSSIPEAAPTLAFALDRPLYYSVHSAVARLAPAGGAIVHVAKYLREDEIDHEALRRELEEYADLVLPTWRQLAERVRYLPRLRVTAAIPDVQGRLGVVLPGLERVTLAGDWVGASGMLADAAVASALEATQTLQRREQVEA
jgi:protoporphyrinogen oxidase